MTLKELKKQLNEEFMEVKRGCMVAVSAISDIGDRILLSNGEKICYTKRKKKVLREELQKNQELIIAKISKKKAAADSRRVIRKIIIKYVMLSLLHSQI